MTFPRHDVRPVRFNFLSMIALLSIVGVYPWFQLEFIYFSLAVLGRLVINLGTISSGSPALLVFSLSMACSSSILAKSLLSGPSTIGTRRIRYSIYAPSCSSLIISFSDLVSYFSDHYWLGLVDPFPWDGLVRCFYTMWVYSPACLSRVIPSHSLLSICDLTSSYFSQSAFFQFKDILNWSLWCSVSSFIDILMVSDRNLTHLGLEHHHSRPYSCGLLWDQVLSSFHLLVLPSSSHCCFPLPFVFRQPLFHLEASSVGSCSKTQSVEWLLKSPASSVFFPPGRLLTGFSSLLFSPIELGFWGMYIFQSLSFLFLARARSTPSISFMLPERIFSLISL